MPFHRPLALALALLFAAGACRSAEAGVDAGDQARFVEVNVALRGAPRDDEGVRDSVLAAHGVSEEWLLEVSGRLAESPERLADTWDEIQRQLSGPDDTAPGGVPPAPAVSRPTPVAADSAPRVRRPGERPVQPRPTPADRPRLGPSLGEVAPPELPAQGSEKRLPGEPQ